MFARLRSSLAGLFHRNRFESAMDDELRFHMAAYADDLVRAGVPRDEAMRRARLQFGGVEAIKEECRQNRGLRWIDEARQDLRYAFRLMAKTPVFTLAAIVSLALGIGANTAIFSLIDAVLFRTVQVAEPDRLYFLAHDPGSNVSTSSNYPVFERYRASPVFSGVTAYRGRTFNVSAGDSVERLSGQFVSGNYHAVLGVPMSLGRGFSAEVDRGPASLIAVISHDYWMNRFGGSPNVLDRTLNVSGRVVSIVGVTATGFRGLAPGGRVDITLPMSVMALSEPAFFDATDGWTSMVLVGRLAPGVSEPRAVSAVDAIFKQFVSEPHSGWLSSASPNGFRSGTLEPAARGTGDLRRGYSTPLLVLMGMVAVVLLIACANIANLLLARATARAREVAVRLSIGASRGRLVRQFLTESLLLGLSGGAIGVLLSLAGTEAILALFNDVQSPILLDVSLNGRVMAFTAAVSTLTALAFGIAPAFRGTAVELAPALKQGINSTRTPRVLSAGKWLVVAQFALCMMMVAGAGILSRSLRNLQGFDAGFVRSGILIADVDTGGSAVPQEQRAAFYSGLIERLRVRPGVAAVSLAARTPIDRSSQTRRIDVPGVVGKPGEGVSTNGVTPGYFETFGIDLVRGRGLTPEDRESSASVALISQSMARAYYGNRDPIG
jgi:predicted permease